MVNIIVHFYCNEERGRLMEKIKCEWKDYTHQFNFRKRVALSIFGVLLMGFGISLFAYSNMGVDPYTCFNMSISGLIKMQFGLWQMIMNGVILVFAVFLSENSPVSALFLI